MSVLGATTVSASYGSQKVLDGVVVSDIQPGEIVGVLGPNGSGKSTLLRALAFKGKGGGGKVKLESDGPIAERSVYMPQSLPSPSPLRAYELLASQARALGDNLSAASLHIQISDVLRGLGISELAMRPMSELSGGQRQLIGYALAISRTPDLLFLDEPTSALDIRWQLRLFENIRRYVSDNRAACLAAVHDIGLAARACDKLLLLSNGAAVATGRPEDVLTEDNLAVVYGVRAHTYQRSDGALGIEILGSENE